MKRLIILLVIFSTTYASLGLAQEKIYKWKDSSGQEHYSNSPVKNAISANLPQIKKENIKGKIENIKKNTPKNCQSRGGVDCNKGPDTDGSVFCLDGYADSRLPFNYHCSQAQLEAEISFNEKDEKNIEVSIVLRNVSPTEARNISLTYHYRKAFQAMGKKQTLKINGKKSIIAYGLETYKASFPKDSRITTIKALKRGRPVLTCDNCKPLRKNIN